MQLNKLILDVTPKSSWQCFDLGCRVALADFRSLFTFWIIATLPLFIVLISIDLDWGFFIFWLGKPWYERGLLYILSQAVFGTKPSVKQALLFLPSQIKPLWFSSITYRRLAPSRSFDMAVTQLEGLVGHKRTKRLGVLHRNSDNNTAWWTICCAHWEFFFCVGMLSLIQMLVPQYFDFYELFNPYAVADSLQTYTLYCVYYVAIAIVAPFYIAGGFVAYLNRRVILEGWDIELGFNKWRDSYLKNAAKKGFSNKAEYVNKNTDDKQDRNTNTGREGGSSGTGTGTTNLLVAIFVICSVNILGNSPAFSQNTENNSSNVVLEAETTLLNAENITVPENPVDESETAVSIRKNEINTDLGAVLNAPPFAQYQTEKGYRWKNSEQEEEDTEKVDFNFSPKIIAFIASSFQTVLWVLFIFLFGYLIIRNWQNIVSLVDKGHSEEDHSPLPSFISTAFTEALPDDVVKGVNEAAKSGDYRRALSILVRASFTFLSKRRHLKITRGMTENECLVEIKENCEPALYGFMQNLLNAWMKMAWAHQLPNTNTLLELTHQYDMMFVNTEQKAMSSEHKSDDSEQKSDW
jgi:hypothetical protein